LFVTQFDIKTDENTTDSASSDSSDIEEEEEEEEKQRCDECKVSKNKREFNFTLGRFARVWLISILTNV